MEPIFERRLLLERLRDCGVAILNGTSVIEITPEGVQARGQTSGWIPCDHVVLEEAPVPDRSLLEELHGKMEIIAVGPFMMASAQVTGLSNSRRRFISSI